ncbi:MAG: hypothetical protein RR202_10760 [Bacteroidales bacterium]
MKTVKFRNLLAAGMSASLLFGFFSCTSDEDKIDPVNNQREITFSFDPMTLTETRTTTTTDPAACPGSDIQNLFVTISLYQEKDGTLGKSAGDKDVSIKDEPLISYSGNLKTVPKQLGEGDYYITDVVIKDAAGDAGNIIYRGVQKDSEFAGYLPSEGLLDPATKIQLTAYDKKDYKLYVLCAHDQPVSFFYNPKFFVDITKLECISLYINRCHPTAGHLLPSGSLSVYPTTVNEAGQVIKPNPLPTPLYTDEFGMDGNEYDFGRLCFGGDNVKAYWIVISGEEYSKDDIEAEEFTKEFGYTKAQLEKIALTEPEGDDDGNGIEWKDMLKYLEVYFCEEEQTCPDFNCVTFNGDVVGTQFFSATQLGKDDWTLIDPASGMSVTSLRIKNRGTSDNYLQATFQSNKNYLAFVSPLFDYTAQNKLNIDFKFLDGQVTPEKSSLTRTWHNDIDKVSVIITGIDVTGNEIPGSEHSRDITIGENCNQWQTIPFTLAGITNGCVKIKIEIVPLATDCKPIKKCYKHHDANCKDDHCVYKNGTHKPHKWYYSSDKEWVVDYPVTVDMDNICIESGIAGVPSMR